MGCLEVILEEADLLLLNLQKQTLEVQIMEPKIILEAMVEQVVNLALDQVLFQILVIQDHLLEKQLEQVY